MSLFLKCLLTKRRDVKSAPYLNSAEGILKVHFGIWSLRKAIVWKSYTSKWLQFVFVGDLFL